MQNSAFENFSEEALDALDFARCQRPDGSFYGTGGVCRKGSPAGAKEKQAPKAKDKVGSGQPSKAVKSGGLGEMTIKTQADMKKMSDDDLKAHMKLANKVAFQNDVSKLTKEQFAGLADQHKMASAELKSRGSKSSSKSGGLGGDKAKTPAAKKPASPAKIASAEKKLAKLEAQADKADAKSREYSQRAREVNRGKSKGGGGAAAQRAAGPMSMARKWSSKADALRTQAYQQKQLLNEMKGIKEEKPKARPAGPKTAAQKRRDKLRKVETRINNRAKQIMEKSGKNSPQFQKFFAKYAPKLENIQEELRKR